MILPWDRTNKMQLYCTKVNSFCIKRSRSKILWDYSLVCIFPERHKALKGADPWKTCFAFGPYQNTPIDVSHGRAEHTQDGSSSTSILAFLDIPGRVV